MKGHFIGMCELWGCSYVESGSTVIAQFNNQVHAIGFKLVCKDQFGMTNLHLEEWTSGVWRVYFFS